MIGKQIHSLAQRLWGINRSITGDGVRETFSILKEVLPHLRLYEVPTGTRVFDWTVPQEWRVRDAYIITPNGETICDFKKNNLHLVGYSIPVSTKLALDELGKHLYSLPNQPNAIPYITSYYKKDWGFCISQQDRDQLKDGIYDIYIDSDLFDGSLTYGEFIIQGQRDQEIFISTYICHPSMANNELSGPTVAVYLAKWISEQTDRRYIPNQPEDTGKIT